MVAAGREWEFNLGHLSQRRARQLSFRGRGDKKKKKKEAKIKRAFGAARLAKA